MKTLLCILCPALLIGFSSARSFTETLQTAAEQVPPAPESQAVSPDAPSVSPPPPGVPGPQQRGTATVEDKDGALQTEQTTEIPEEIQDARQAFVDAYEKGDAKAVAAHFTENGEYVDESGYVTQGRDSIEQLLQQFFSEHPKCRLEVSINSVRMISEGVAIEDGLTRVTHLHGPEGTNPVPENATFTPSDQSTVTQPAPVPSATLPAPASPGTPSPEVLSDNSPTAPLSVSDPEARALMGIECRYTAVHVKVDGKWLLGSVRDLPTDSSVSESSADHMDMLGQLDWLNGDWVDEGDDAIVTFSCRPTDNGCFLLRTFSIVIAGEEAMSGTQRIGWDPLTGKLRTWIFDSEGGYADGYWHRDEERWVLKCSGVNAVGEPASFTTIYTPVNEHTMTWQYVDYEVAGIQEPDSEIYTIVRQAPAPADTGSVSDVSPSE